MKDKKDVINEFNELVNMTASELEKWLKSGDSRAAGWPKEDEGGESVGHDSGRKIVQIIKDNPQKSPEKYTDEQVEHMRKVVSYCKRHLAQEGKINETKSAEEVKKTKSYASLKNWGHDCLKEREGNDEADEGEDDEEDVGTKRGSKDSQNGENKKQKTEKSASRNPEADHNGATTESANKQDTKDDAETKEDTQASSSDEANGEEDKKSTKAEKNGSSGEGADKKEPKKGDTVSWNWGQGQPEGTVEKVKHEKASVTTKKGNTVSRDGTAEDPAVIIDAGQSKAVKLNHELN